MARKVGKHSDLTFIKKFHRYCLINIIMEADSFKDLQEKIKKSRVGKNEDSILLFQEFKFFNLIIKIEYLLVSLIRGLYKNKIVKKEDLRKFIFRQVRKFRYLNKEEAKKLVSKETEGKERRIYTPHMLFYIVGLGFGGLVHIIKVFTNSFTGKKDILSKLIEFRDHRNDFIHNLLSSRINSEKNIKRALKLGRELEENLEKIIGEYDKNEKTDKRISKSHR